MCSTAKKGQKRHSTRGPSGFHRLQQQAPTAGLPPPPPADPSAPPDAGLDADEPMTEADPDPPNHLHKALADLMRTAWGELATAQAAGDGPKEQAALKQLADIADRSAKLPRPEQHPLLWSLGSATSGPTHAAAAVGAAGPSRVPATPAAATDGATAVAAAPPPLIAPPAPPLFHSGWNDGARHQVPERLWYLLLRIGLVDGNVVLQSVLRDIPLPDRASQLKALGQCMATVFNVATGSRSEGDQHFRYYKRLSASSAEGPSMHTSKGQRRWTLQPWEMGAAYNAFSALLLQAMEAANGGDLEAGLVDQLQGVVPKMEEMAAEPVEVEVEELQLGDSTPQNRLSILKDAFHSGKLSCSGVDCAQHWMALEQRVEPCPECPGEERPPDMEYWSKAAHHEACRLKVLLSTETLEVCIMAWGAQVLEPAWLSHAARGPVTCLSDLAALLTELHTRVMPSSLPPRAVRHASPLECLQRGCRGASLLLLMGAALPHRFGRSLTWHATMQPQCMRASSSMPTWFHMPQPLLPLLPPLP